MNILLALTLAQTVAVPFAGCPADGQAGPKPAPKAPKSIVCVDAAVAGRLAYYESADGLGVLAPRGWQCLDTYGSSGNGLLVAPKLQKTGPAVQLDFRDGGTSGRYYVAAAIARIFPARRDFITGLLRDFDGAKAVPLPQGPYPTDKLTYLTPTMAEFETPANTQGLGTQFSWLTPDPELPIRGLILLRDPAPDLVTLSVRLPSADSSLTTAILQQARHKNSAGR